MNITKTFAVCLAAVLFAAACTERNEPQGTNDTIRVDTGSSVDLETGNVLVSSPLKKFDDCDQLLSHLRTTYAGKATHWGFDALLSLWYKDNLTMRDIIQNEVENFDRSDVDVVHMGIDVLGAQVSEADIIKTDGSRIYVVSQTDNTPKLFVVDVANHEIAGAVDLAGQPLAMLLHGNRLIVIQHSRTYDQQVIVQSVFVDDKGLPEVNNTIRIDGTYQTSTKVDDTAHIVIWHSNYKDSTTFPFVHPDNDSGISEEQAKQYNKDALLNSTLEDWLPHYYHDDDKKPAGFLSPCDNTYVPYVADDNLGITSVISLPFGEQFSVDRTTSVIASAYLLHDSTGSLYMKNSTMNGRHGTEQRYNYIHRFNLSEGKAEYTASGAVPGYINRQPPSISEHEGYLRVLSSSEDKNGNLDTRIRVFDIATNPIAEVSSIKLKNAAPAYVWFIGNVGYVVTLRETEPIYAVGLSDPINPYLIAELDMPGFLF